MVWTKGTKFLTCWPCILPVLKEDLACSFLWVLILQVEIVNIKGLVLKHGKKVDKIQEKEKLSNESNKLTKSGILSSPYPLINFYLLFRRSLSVMQGPYIKARHLRLAFTHFPKKKQGEYRELPKTVAVIFAVFSVMVSSLLPPLYRTRPTIRDLTFPSPHLEAFCT